MDPWHEKQWKGRLRRVFPQILNADGSWLAPTAGWDGFPWAVAAGLVLALHTSSMCSGVRPTQPCRDSCSHGDICRRHRPSHPRWGSLQMSLWLGDTELFVTFRSESVLLRILFMLGALITTLMNKLAGTERENGSVWTSLQHWLHKAQPFSSNSAFGPLILRTVDKGNYIDHADFLKIPY